ncbi:hypothetical protein Golax_015501, partial [Gossypium laxum]|nr:hypothetical protein [Gossypium laxum]
NITRTILKSIDPDSPDQSDLNLLQVKLNEKLSGKRFLLVLDESCLRLEQGPISL